MTDDELIEKVAQLIYETWCNTPGYVAWIPEGNSIQQDRARGDARTVIAIARPIIEREALEKAWLRVRNLQVLVDDEFTEGYSHGLVDATSVIDALMEQSK